MKDIINILSKKINDMDEYLGSLVFNSLSNSDTFKDITIKDINQNIRVKEDISLKINVEKKSPGNYSTVVTGDVNKLKKKDIGTTGADGKVVDPTGILIKFKKDIQKDLKDTFGDNIHYK